MKETLSGTIIDEQSSALLSKINQIAESLSQMLNLRYNLRCKFNNQDEESLIGILQSNSNNLTMSDVDPKDTVCQNSLSDATFDTRVPENNSVNQELHNDIDSVKYTRRLPKKTLDVLNEWYQENVENPYLTRDDIVMLKSRTSLSENQIKNWASNKRRKRKEAKISQEVSELLGPI